jgi:hypothetical protein
MMEDQILNLTPNDVPPLDSGGSETESSKGKHNLEDQL